MMKLPFMPRAINKGVSADMETEEIWKRRHEKIYVPIGEGNTRSKNLSILSICIITIIRTKYAQTKEKHKGGER
jgi:hypothetical protein